MALYNIAEYGVDIYGQASKLEYSVEPFTATAIDYTKVQVSWTSPSGDGTRIRLVRNQSSFPETPEDGTLLYEWVKNVSSTQVSELVDGDVASTAVPLTSGRFVYYRIWILKPSNVWVSAGSTYVLLPREHSTVTPDGKLVFSTHDKVMDYLPRMYTTDTQSPLDEVSTTTDLYHYLKGFSFKLDEMLTYADLVLPEESGNFSSPSITLLQTLQYGITPEALLGTKSQKRLVREALFIYRNKGTLNGISTYAESVTGFAPDVTPSPNVLLTTADSTFYKGKGFWTAETGITLTSTTEAAQTTTTETYAVDTAYSGKAVIATSNKKIANGTDFPITRGTPIVAGAKYTFSYYVKTASGTVPVTPTLKWYDYKGNVLRTDVAASATNATTTWTKQSLTKFAPGYEGYAFDYVISSGTATLTLESAHPFTTGDTVVIEGFDLTEDGEVTLTATTSTTISFDTGLSDDTVTDGFVTVAQTGVGAVYCGFELLFGSTGTVYVDMVQLADYSVTNFHEARAVEIFLNPSKTNLLLNPSFDAPGSSHWTIDAGTSSYVTPSTNPLLLDASGMLQVVTKSSGASTVSSSTGPVLTGRFYTFSVYLKASAAVTLQLKLAQYNEATSTEATAATQNVAVTTAWQRFHVTKFVPDSEDPHHLNVYITGNGAGKTVYFDGSQLEAAYNPTDYFDGDVPVSWGGVWAGTANNSVSYLYPNRAIKMTLLDTELKDFLPINAPYVISTYRGVEKKGM